MKPTLRKNGERMFTIALKIHVGRNALVQAVLLHRLFKPSDPAPKTRTGDLKEVRYFFKEYGDGFWYKHEKCEGEDEAHAEAVQVVDRLFPDLRKP